MNWVKGFALVTCLATPLSVILAVSADAAPSAGSTVTASGTQVAALSDAEKKAKLSDCSKQADAKKLHGEERRKFRATCIKG